MTLADVEARAGLSDGNLSRIERGRQWLTEEKLHSIASALGVQPYEFFIDDDAQPNQLDGEVSPSQNIALDEAAKEWLDLRNYLGSDDISEFKELIMARQQRNIRLLEELDALRGKQKSNIVSATPVGVISSGKKQISQSS